MKSIGTLVFCVLLLLGCTILAPFGTPMVQKEPFGPAKTYYVSNVLQDSIGTSNSSLSGLISTINDRAEIILNVNENIHLINNTIVPSNVFLIVHKGSTIDINNKQLAIEGPFEAGPYQVFIRHQKGSVTFALNSSLEAFVAWWGVGPQALQAAFKCGIPHVVVNESLEINTSTIRNKRYQMVCLDPQGVIVKCP